VYDAVKAFKVYEDDNDVFAYDAVPNILDVIDVAVIFPNTLTLPVFVTEPVVINEPVNTIALAFTVNIVVPAFPTKLVVPETVREPDITAEPEKGKTDPVISPK
jgi:hypothetical protein